jgi:Protein of unknown function (DUF3638)/Protein of unknown function (DUF3645)
MRLLSLTDKEDELIKELQNVGHENWDPRQYPESLLLEIENGIMVRNAQQQIVKEIIDLPMGCNKVMQLNMGEGKSSVIVPILASVLAGPSSLLRVIVAKPQARQMHQVLVSKLGGLLNRRVYHMPFFRGINPSEEDAEQIGLVCRECMANGGVLLVQPEQLLSFKLMGIESLIENKQALGHSLLKTQNFFDKSSRDVVDESDENFSTKFELVYAMGSQQSIELSPERWFFMQQLLSLVGKLASEVKTDFPHDIEVDKSRLGAFPKTRLLRPGARRDLLERITKHICDAEYVMSGLAIHRQSTGMRQAISRYILERDPSTQEISLIQDDASEIWTGTTRRLLLLLRGILAGGVLPFALEKRWRVPYGLDRNRIPPTKLAVRYRGKDCPTVRSEFSDPDTVILLTCLSYYYGGLTDDDLFLALSHVAKSDQADVEYQLWVEDAPELDRQFQQLAGVSLEDRLFCVELVFPALRYSKRAIDSLGMTYSGFSEAAVQGHQALAGNMTQGPPLLTTQLSGFARLYAVGLVTAWCIDNGSRMLTSDEINGTGWRFCSNSSTNYRLWFVRYCSIWRETPRSRWINKDLCMQACQKGNNSCSLHTALTLGG